MFALNVLNILTRAFADNGCLIYQQSCKDVCKIKEPIKTLELNYKPFGFALVFTPIYHVYVYFELAYFELPAISNYFLFPLPKNFEL